MDLGVYILRVYIYIYIQVIYIYMYIDISLRDVHQQKQLAATWSSHEILRNGEELFRAASEPKEMVLIKGGGLAAAAVVN